MVSMWLSRSGSNPCPSTFEVRTRRNIRDDMGKLMDVFADSITEMPIPCTPDTHPLPRDYVQWVLVEQHRFPVQMPPWIPHIRTMNIPLTMIQSLPSVKSRLPILKILNIEFWNPYYPSFPMNVFVPAPLLRNFTAGRYVTEVSDTVLEPASKNQHQILHEWITKCSRPIGTSIGYRARRVSSGQWIPRAAHAFNQTPGPVQPHSLQFLTAIVSVAGWG